MPEQQLTESTQLLKERREQFIALLAPCQRQVESYVFTIEKVREEALDLLGETLLRAWEHFDQLRDPKAFHSWLLTIARRAHRDRHRKGHLFREEYPGYADELVSDRIPPDLQPDIQTLYNALQKLPHKQREAIVLFELNGFSLREVIQIQGGSVPALKVRLHRGRKKLATLLAVENTDLRERQESQAMHGKIDITNKLNSRTEHTTLLSTP